MLPDYYAHIRINNNIEEKQTVLEHLEGVSELAESFAESFNAGNEGRLAGLSHDIGKYSMKFQKRLLGGTIVDHSTAGAYECWKLKNNSAAVAVAGHHGGIPNYGSKTDTENDATFCGRMKRARNGKLEDYSEWRNKLDLPQTVSSEYRDAFHIRMLYSALVDADFLDTETFMNGGIEREKCRITISELYNRFEQSISCWYPPKGKLNNERCKILDNCKALADRPSGLFKLTVPTGAGKTVASLAFALRHAIKNNLKHVIYVIPYTSIIEQTADIFREKLGCDAVLEHHSLVDYESQSENEADRIKMIRATENWDMPIIVTSAVQFFESIFSNKPSKCRKLHNIAKSVVIFDEAQMIPIPYLIPCTDVMSQLIVQCNSSCVLCTATQPSLERFFPESIVKNSVELCPNDLEREVFKRVKFQNDGMLETAEVAERMINFDQVLCIVNSRKAAKHGNSIYFFILGGSEKRISSKISGLRAALNISFFLLKRPCLA